MEVMGETIDDAAGEAFDKVAKILGLPYPGGPLVDKYAQTGNPAKFKFPHPRVDGLNFSFSGLKTSVLYFLQNNLKADQNFITNNLNDICASIQHTIVSILLAKVKMAVEQTGIKQVALAGGVSANSLLRTQLKETGAENNWKVFIPKFEYCTDNAAMIAAAAYYKFLKQDFCTITVTPSPRYNFK
jgi:N6-L-threonylcarbamoyladenine synthase